MRVKCWQIRCNHFGSKLQTPLIVVVCLALFGCWGDRWVPLDAKKLPRKVAGTADAQVIALQSKLTRENVKVITIGEDYLISIPSAIIFPDQSPQPTWKSYYVLNQVVDFLKQFRKVAVNVTGYASPYQSTQREQSLSLARAKAISNYLWSQGIDSRFIFAEGAGREKPVISTQLGGDRSLNSRIEITFRDAII